MQNTVGISFSDNHCYLTQFTQENEILSLSGVTSFFYEQDSLGAIESNIDTIKSYLSKSTRVVLALPSQDILLKNLVVDAALTDEEIIFHIQSQSLILFGHTPEQLCFDYESHFMNGNNRHLIVTACHQHKISSYQALFNQLKMPLDVIDVDVFSLLRITFFLTNETDIILLFQYNNQLLVIVTQNGKLQKIERFDFIFSDALTQLNLPLSPGNKTTVFSADHKLKTHLDQLGIPYNELDIASLFNARIQNKSAIPNHALHPFFISMGAGLWSVS